MQEKAWVFFGKSVMRGRRRRRLSVGDLAAITGTGVREMLEVEQGKRFPDEMTLLRLIHELDLTPDWVFSLHDDRTAEQVDSIIRLIKCFDEPELDQIQSFIQDLAGEQLSATR